MRKPCVARPLSSSFGTVFLFPSNQALGVLALYNLFPLPPMRWRNRFRKKDSLLLMQMDFLLDSERLPADCIRFRLRQRLSI